MFIYLCVDVFSFFNPGVIEDILLGRIWVLDITPVWALAVLVVMTIPSLLVLLSLTLPATGSEVVAEIGDREVNTVHESYTIAELVPDTNAERFDSPADVQTRVRRPTVPTAMKRVLEASESLPRTIRHGTPLHANEKTFQALQSIEADDDDEGIAVIGDCIVVRISADKELPGSRAVRSVAASWCREQGYQVSSDEWLGV